MRKNLKLFFPWSLKEVIKVSAKCQQSDVSTTSNTVTIAL